MKKNHHKGTFLEVQWHSKLMHWYRWQSLKIPGFNTLARMVMSLKYHTKSFSVNRSNIHALTSAHQLIFGLSSFRSGSTFLADLLAKNLPFAQVEHESNINDYWSYMNVLQEKQLAMHYFNSYRKYELLNRLDVDKQVYIEMSPYLVLHTAALKKAFPNAILFHLVRDGRAVVRSMMAREIMGEKDPMTPLMQPPKTDPYSLKWDKMSRFQKVCWKWQYENKELRQQNLPLIHLELLLNDYHYFKTQVLDLLKIDIPYQNWEKARKNAQHASPRQLLPHWTKWDKKHLVQFEEICGEEMNKLSYPTINKAPIQYV